MFAGKREIVTAASGGSSFDIKSNDTIESTPNGKTDVECRFLEIPDAVFPTETFVKSVDSRTHVQDYRRAQHECWAVVSTATVSVSGSLD